MQYLSQKAIDLIIKSAIPFIYINNRNKKYVVKKGGKDKFHIRVGTSDMIIFWENYWLKEYFDKELNIKPTDIVLDIGSHIGIFTVLAARAAYNGKVYSFEANPENYKMLVKNIKFNKLSNVIPHCMAVTSHNGSTYLYLGGPNIGAGSLFKQAFRNRTIKVKSDTLENILNKNGLKRIDFLKLDVEGAEYGILMTAKPKVLKKIKAIALEYHDNMTGAGSSLVLLEFLKKCGFVVRFNTNILIRKIFKTGIIIAQRK